MTDSWAVVTDYRWPRISRTDSRVAAWIVPTNEEVMIAQHARRLIAASRR